MAYFIILNWFCVFCVVLRTQLPLRISCNDDYFLDENGLCKKCPEQCLFCDSAQYCLACRNGFWGSSCESPCSSCKLETSCDKTNGFCLEACRDGYTGVLCDSQCQKKCLSCNRTNADHCLTCPNDKYGSSCDRFCSRTCYHKTCDVAKDLCTLRCTNGNWDATCKENCPEECSYSCNWQNGQCTDSREDTDHKNPADVGIDKGLLIALVVLGAFCLLAVIIIYRFRYKICEKISKKNGTRIERTISRDDTELAPLKDTAKAIEAAEGASHCQSDIEKGYNDTDRKVSKKSAIERQTEIPLLQESKTKTKDMERSLIMPTGNIMNKAEAELSSQQRADGMKKDTKHTTNPDKSENYKGKTTLWNLVRRLEKTHKKDYKKEFEDNQLLMLPDNKTWLHCLL